MVKYISEQDLQDLQDLQDSLCVMPKWALPISTFSFLLAAGMSFTIHDNGKQDLQDLQDLGVLCKQRF